MAGVERQEAARGGHSERPATCGAERQHGLVGSWATEHCDHVLDSIDAHISQWQSRGEQVLGSSGDHNVSSDTPFGASWPAELEEHPVAKAENLQGEARQSSSSSVCTEDFAARFQEGMVESLVLSEDEEDEPFLVWSRHASDVPQGGNDISCSAEDHDTGQNESSISTGRRQDVPWRLEVDLGSPLQSTSPSLIRRQSLESLGGRISRLSRSKAVTADLEPASSLGWGAPTPAPSEQGCILHGDNVRVSSTRRHAGVPASRASVSADSSFPRDAGAGTGWCHVNKPERSRQQKPPDCWGRTEAATAPVLSDVDVEGARDRLRRAQSWARCTQTAVRPPWMLSLDSSGDGGTMDTYSEPLWCGGSHWRNSGAERWAWSPGKEAKTWLPRGSLEASLDRKLQSQLLTDGNTWRAEKKGIIQSQHGLLEEQSQGAFAACQEGLEKELRSTSALQEEKLELQKRLHELEHRTRSLLQRRQEALDELHVLLQKEKMYMLWQLQEALQQEQVCDSARLHTRRQRPEQQHPLRPPHRETTSWEPAVPGQPGCSLARPIPMACQRLHALLPDSSTEQSPSPAPSGSSPVSPIHAFRALRGLSEETQRLRDSQTKREAQRCSALHHQREKEPGLRQLRGSVCVEKEAGPRTLKEQLIQRPSKYPPVSSTSSLPSSTVPGLRQQNFRPLGVLHQVQNRTQELQAETTSTGHLEKPSAP